MNRALLLVGLCAALALPTASVEAHEFWLAPSRYVAQPGVAVEVRALTGEGFRGERKAWSPAHCVRFVARTARTVDVTRAATPGDSVWARFAASDAGGALLAFESGFTPIELPAAQFNAYLEEDGLDGPLAERRRSAAEKPGRERYRRCAKTWLAGADETRAIVALGLPLEIVPLAVPGMEPILHARVLWNGRPLPGALVNVWRAPLGIGRSSTDAATPDSIGIAWQGRTDMRGEVSVPVPGGGEWLVSLVHMVPCTERDEADWESTWASLTFERTAEEAPPRGASR
jgi:uncharacterized GH25 family protein